jgi:hypothetical protein
LLLPTIFPDPVRHWVSLFPFWECCSSFFLDPLLPISWGTMFGIWNIYTSILPRPCAHPFLLSAIIAACVPAASLTKGLDWVTMSSGYRKNICPGIQVTPSVSWCLISFSILISKFGLFTKTCL